MHTNMHTVKVRLPVHYQICKMMMTVSFRQMKPGQKREWYKMNKEDDSARQTWLN